MCIGQVTHALLTRPPLTPKGSLDLHVLGTPPAFILSQDQTLKIMVSEVLRRRLDTGLILKLKTLALFALRLLILPNYCFKKLSDTLHACLPIVLGFLWFLSLGWLFDQISTLWSFQGSLPF